jgi:hypothetical protein
MEEYYDDEGSYYSDEGSYYSGEEESYYSDEDGGAYLFGTAMCPLPYL